MLAEVELPGLLVLGEVRAGALGQCTLGAQRALPSACQTHRPDASAPASVQRHASRRWGGGTRGGGAICGVLMADDREMSLVLVRTVSKTSRAPSRNGNAKRTAYLPYFSEA